MQSWFYSCKHHKFHSVLSFLASSTGLLLSWAAHGLLVHDTAARHRWEQAAEEVSGLGLHGKAFLTLPPCYTSKNKPRKWWFQFLFRPEASKGTTLLVSRGQHLTLGIPTLPPCKNDTSKNVPGPANHGRCDSADITGSS